jgi:multifunctional beta-oxidation protein
MGAKRTHLPLVYENDAKFHVLPTFGVVPTYFSKSSSAKNGDLVPNFNPKMLLHGEQYLEILAWPIPTAAELVTTSKLLEVVDKGNAAVVKRANITRDEKTGRPVFYNEGTAFIRGSGNFGGPRAPADRGASTSPNNPPNRPPDAIVEEKISEEAAALYRLLGDRNPLHIDPAFSKAGGFDVPILHGLATFGMAGKHVCERYGAFRNIKVRFAGPVLPGQTIVTEMWRENGENRKVVFRVKVRETGKLAISNAAVELMEGPKAHL